MPIHHLTSAEYNNTVAHLLGTKLRPADYFPSAAATGFDANVGVLSGVSQVLLQGYYDAAKELAADAFANGAQREKILICEPASAKDTACPERIVDSFGLRAFRRPLEAAERSRYVKKYGEARSTLGMTHEKAAEHVVRIMLTSPNFLLRIELDKNPGSTEPRPLDGYELASRLSYLLWSSMPDDALFDLAKEDGLGSKASVEAQVDRMLADPKSQGFFDNFFGQWLGTRQLDSHHADKTLFPEWSEDIQQAMVDQANAYLTEFTVGERRWSDFLSAPHPASTPLDPIYAEDPEGGRSGFLTLPAFLTLSSLPERTSPTSRAKTIIVGLFCTNISPPANLNIPDLGAAGGGDVDIQNVRKKLEAHRKDPACAGCHNTLDPIGLSLENYDAVGRYRTEYTNGDPIDATGTYAGASFQDIAGLVPELVEDTRFLTCPPNKLFSYALRRTPTTDDKPYIDSIVAGWKGGTISDLAKRVTTSDAFRNRVPNLEAE
ncbi:Cellulose-binding domain protein [Minicystis rosea]|nr:Cellulose-binding domain protein [Minicystis rosea]